MAHAWIKNILYLKQTTNINKYRPRGPTWTQDG